MIIRSNPIEVNFFAAVKSFDANTAIIGHFCIKFKELDWVRATIPIVRQCLPHAGRRLCWSTWGSRWSFGCETSVFLCYYFCKEKVLKKSWTLQDYPIMIQAHYGNFKKSTMNITICRVFCLMLNCDKWRPCFKANKHCFNHIMLDHMIWKGINVWPNKQNEAGSAREIACELTNLIQTHKNIILPFLIQFLHDSFQNMPVCQTFWYITLSTWNILVTVCQFSKTLRKRFL